MAKDSYYQRNREAVLARRKVRRQTDPEKYREQGRKQMARWRATNPRKSPYHKLTSDDILARAAAQGGCAICGCQSSRWHGDHDHSTGNFRAVLCNRCNMALGLFRDNEVICRAAADYLKRHSDIGSLL